MPENRRAFAREPALIQTRGLIAQGVGADY